jgi:multiple sugar transport system permease protein
LHEAAVIDGAGAVKRLFKVTIPYIKPTIVSTLLLRTMWIVNMPDIIYAMTNGGPVNKTNILATQMINKVFKEYDYGQGSAIGLIIMFLLFIYSIFYLRLTSRKDD